MFEELQELGDHDVEGPVESITVEKLRRVFTDLLQSTKGALKTTGSSQAKKNKKIPQQDGCPFITLDQTV